MVCHAARELDRIDVAMTKVFTTQVTNGIMGLAVQCCGGNGIGKDPPIAHFYESVGPFRIVDGADEVHKRTVAREAFADVPEEELDALTRYDG